MTRRRRIGKVVFGVLASGTLALVCAAWPGCSTFTISPETTYVTGPLLSDGTVDYASALNERLRKDIRPEDNANVLICQVLGPKPEGRPLPAEYYQWLGMEEPPPQGDFFVSFLTYLEKTDPEKYQQRREEFFKREHTLYGRPWSAREEPEAAAWLRSIEGPLVLLTKATRRSEYFNPVIPPHTEDWSAGLIQAPLPTAGMSRALAAVLCSRAMLRTGEGRYGELGTTCSPASGLAASSAAAGR